MIDRGNHDHAAMIELGNDLKEKMLFKIWIYRIKNWGNKNDIDKKINVDEVEFIDRDNVYENSAKKNI